MAVCPSISTLLSILIPILILFKFVAVNSSTSSVHNFSFSSTNNPLCIQQILNTFSSCTFFISPDTFGDDGGGLENVASLWEREVFSNYPVVLVSGNASSRPGVMSTEPICSVGFGNDLQSQPPVTFFVFIPNTTTTNTFNLSDGISIKSLVNSSTIYLGLSEDQQLFVICPHCPEPFVPTTLDLTSLTIGSISQAAIRLTKNLHGHSILYPDLDVLQLISNCERLGQKFSGEERICTIKSIVTKILNGTLIFGNQGADSSSSSRSNSPAVVGFVRNTLLEYLQPWHYEYLPNGHVFEPYSFAIILDKSSGRQFDLNPLDKRTDAAKKLSLVLLAMIFGFRMTFCPPRRHLTNVVKKPKKRERIRRSKELMLGGKRETGKLIGRLFNNVATAYVQLAMPLYDHGDVKIGTRLALGPSDRGFYLVLMTWLLISSLVINGSYKGALFSILTKEVPSKTPENLRDLVQAVQFAILSPEFRRNPQTHAMDSILWELIHEEMESGRLSASDSDMYATLRDRVQVFAASQGTIIGAYQTGLNIANILLPTTASGAVGGTRPPPRPEVYKIPKDFAIIGFRSAVHHFVTLMKEFPNVFVLEKSYADPFLSLKLVTVTSQNVFGQRSFPVHYAQIHESGIYRKWAENRERLILQYDKFVMTCLYGAGNPEEAYRSKACHNYEKSRRGSPRPLGGRHGKRLSLTIILKVGDNFLWPGLIFAFFAFLCEIVLCKWKICEGRRRFKKLAKVYQFPK